MIKLRRAAIVAFVLHLLAAVCMGLILRHGLETNPDLQDRLMFVANSRALWTFAWLTWTAAALAILYFFDAFASAHRLPTFPVLLTAAAIAPDLSAQAIEIGITPTMTQQPETFLLLHLVAVLLSGYLANGLYSVSTLMMAWAARRIYPAWVSGAAIVVGCSGLTLSVAVVLDSVQGMFWTNAVLLPALLVWLAAVTLKTRSDITVQ